MAEKVIAGLMNCKDVPRQLGYPPPNYEDPHYKQQIRRKIGLMLAAQGYDMGDAEGDDVSRDLVFNHREKSRMLQETTTCPIIRRLQAFIDGHLADVSAPTPQFPRDTLVLASHGIARELSLPRDGDMAMSETLTSYRLGLQGVLHNPKNDKRTTQGSFHIAEGGLMISSDKYRVPKAVFAKMLAEAFRPPPDHTVVPYTTGGTPGKEAHAMASLLVRPMVCPKIPGVREERSMEILMIAPGTLVSCLDFIESIFGNAGDPYLPQNDAALDVEHWSGHTGFIIMAPHLPKVTKQYLGLPKWDDATELQRAQGMCWKDPAEPYNDGRAFKCCCRTEAGVIITIIADNYYGYCKKEVKTQLSYAANLMGMAEEEHAGGTLAFSRYAFGDLYDAGAEAKKWPHLAGYTFDEAMRLLGPEAVEMKEGGWAMDRQFPNVVYVPETTVFNLKTNTVMFGQTTLKLNPKKTYILPSGFKMCAEHHPAAPTWRLVGTEGRGIFLHKPCTVSGGGKSELSKSIDGVMQYGPLYLSDPEKDLDIVEGILAHDFSTRFKDTTKKDSRPLHSDERTLGSVIKLLSPSSEFTDEYNTWLRTIPAHLVTVICFIKRFVRPGEPWRARFKADLINGTRAHQLKFDGVPVTAGVLRVGLAPEDKSWRTFLTRLDFVPASKVQLEDDISTSVTVPSSWLPPSDESNADLPGAPKVERHSHKLVINCEFRLFQRPDDCIHRGEDAQTEWDLAQRGNFIANFEPLHPAAIQEIVEDVSGLEKFTPPMRDFLSQAANSRPESFVVASDHTRLVAGKPTANPRYLQTRPDAVNAMGTYIGDVGQRLARRIPTGRAVVSPVDMTLMGRRISRPGPNLPTLTVYSPIHYQELPEMFMDLFCCVSGTSPSTTGAGSEGALTKGPFNAVPFSADLNNLLTCYMLTGLGGWSTPTGFVGPKMHFAHDASFFSPEVYCRMHPHERNPAWLMSNGYLERVQDFEHQGRKVVASRIGWRITEKFAHFLGRVFESPHVVFEDEVLRPEKQDLAKFVEGIDEIVTVQKVIAQRYFDDGTVDLLVPPLKALCHIMVHGHYEGKDLSSPEIRGMFTRDSLLKSKWYHDRLVMQQKRDVDLWTRHVGALEKFIAAPANAEPVARLGLEQRLAYARKTLAEVSDPKYPDTLVGTIGCDPVTSPK